MTPEFSRPERLDAIGAGEREVRIAADEGERTALARRFGVLSVERLAAVLTIRREAAGIAVRGQVTGAVVQACSVTGAPLDAAIDEPVALLFVEALDEQEEVELDSGALDVVEIEGGAVDLGEAAAETMALALDPFPRGPEAEATLRAAGVISEDEHRPIGALHGLKALLDKR
ncbi:uncharacterized metal-binding protein YceD (DUF177 family) [Sphingomonas insulae]|uniref:DUF177 domain-containing protein n=1 Tax=Sphingomonas insulae TaxID=424800 RepID=A0ABN1HMI0_9SPHN|nr:DUF177 domain-containing protein [Sphingomonas insulae]NIJ30029.1 uncharacterized metal-binding protein YceD (DUF177 family) [Sphingomonas insulae]